MKEEANFWMSLTLYPLWTKLAEADDCSPTNVASKLVRCNILAVSVSSFTSVSTFKSKLFSYCDSLECNTACRESIEKPCLSQGMVYDDLKAKRVIHRYMCAIKGDVVKAVENCGSLDYWTCIQNLNTAVRDAVLSLRLHPDNYKSYLGNYCTAIHNFLACKSSTPWQPEYSCTNDLAAIMTNITDVSLSMEVCGVPQTNPLFNSTYARPVDTNIVHTCGGLGLKMSYLLLVIVLQSLMGRLI